MVPVVSAHHFLYVDMTPEVERAINEMFDELDRADWFVQEYYLVVDAYDSNREGHWPEIQKISESAKHFQGFNVWHTYMQASMLHRLHSLTLRNKKLKPVRIK